MNAFSKYVFAIVLVTGTAIGLSEFRSASTGARESSQPSSDLTWRSVAALLGSPLGNVSSWVINSQFSPRVAFDPSPNPAPSGTGGSGTR
ncbi:MAG: hypothetical protein HC780_10450 [Leptolyngbyaceae cyanobacterium CSU_1_3]|nr:hypothetical protein [Leptolyngbyaceae cyanobacterium CSU_1_3]